MFFKSKAQCSYLDSNPGTVYINPRPNQAVSPTNLDILDPSYFSQSSPNDIQAVGDHRVMRDEKDSHQSSNRYAKTSKGR